MHSIKLCYNAIRRNNHELFKKNIIRIKIIFLNYLVYASNNSEKCQNYYKQVSYNAWDSIKDALYSNDLSTAKSSLFMVRELTNTYNNHHSSKANNGEKEITKSILTDAFQVAKKHGLDLADYIPRYEETMRSVTIRNQMEVNRESYEAQATNSGMIKGFKTQMALGITPQQAMDLYEKIQETVSKFKSHEDKLMLNTECATYLTDILLDAKELFKDPLFVLSIKDHANGRDDILQTFEKETNNTLARIVTPDVISSLMEGKNVFDSNRTLLKLVDRQNVLDINPENTDQYIKQLKVIDSALGGISSVSNISSELKEKLVDTYDAIRMTDRIYSSSQNKDDSVLRISANILSAMEQMIFRPDNNMSM